MRLLEAQASKGFESPFVLWMISGPLSSLSNSMVALLLNKKV